MIRFIFNERKTAQAAAHLLILHGGKMNYMVLIKLLYLSDRKSLIKTGSPITGDHMVSMPHGPVLSMLLDLINMGKEDSFEKSSGEWFEYISEPERYDVSLAKQDPKNDELSKYELGVLEEVNRKFGNLTQWQLRDLTHDLPEYVDPRGSSLPIEPETILQAANISHDEIRQLSERVEEVRFLDSIRF